MASGSWSWNNSLENCGLFDIGRSLKWSIVHLLVNRVMALDPTQSILVSSESKTATLCRTKECRAYYCGDIKRSVLASVRCFWYSSLTLRA
ncbi:MAG: hypothetical protein Q8P93_01205 [bacterium]|nr:hypothetical protein [bacterium]